MKLRTTPLMIFKCCNSCAVVFFALAVLAVVTCSAADAYGQNAFDDYRECLRKCTDANEACLRELRQMEQNSANRDAACRAQAQSAYDSIIASCPNQQQHPAEYAQCRQKAEDRRSQLNSGCDTQLAAEQAAIAAKRASCEVEQAKMRRKCCLDLLAALQRAQSSGTDSSSSVSESDALTEEVCEAIADSFDPDITDEAPGEFLLYYGLEE